MQSEDQDAIFPAHLTLEEVQEAVHNMDEFKMSVYPETDDSDILFFNYRFCTQKTFPPVDASQNLEPRERRLRLIRRECRGLVFRLDKTTGQAQVAARMFHKFFNVGERPDTAESLLDLNRPHVLLEKQDGSLVAPVLFRDGVQFATKSGFTNVAALMQERFLVHNPHYETFAKEWLTRGYTPLFEWCSPRNIILLPYEEDQLILLGMRHNATGHYLPHHEVAKVAKEANILMTGRLELDSSGMNPGDLLGMIKGREQIEGFVIAFQDGVGELFKVKTEWYFARANQKKTAEVAINSERSIWALVLSQTLDDVAESLDPVLRESIEEFSAQLFEAVGQLHKRTRQVAARHSSKRELVAELKQLKDPLLPDSLCFKLFDAMAVGEDTWELVRNWCLSNTNSTKGLEQMRVAFDGLKFVESRPVNSN